MGGTDPWPGEPVPLVRGLERRDDVELVRIDPALRKDPAARLAAYAEAEMKPDSPRVVKYLADVESLAVNFYARRFTAEEMQAIAAFQTSPAGRKFQALTPELGSQIAARTMLFQGDVIRTIEKGAAAQQK